MSPDDIIRKIRRCLALSKSAEPHEAAAAMRQAQKLTEQLGADSPELHAPEVLESRVLASSVKVQAWEARLARLVADTMGCDMYLSTGMRRKPNTCWVPATHFVLVGVAPSHELAAYALDVLQRQCKTQRLAHVRKQPGNCKPITKTARGDAFAMGWVQGVEQLLERFAATERHAAALLAYMERKYPDLGAAKLQRRDTGRNVRNGDYSAGRAAGGSAQLHHGLSTGGAPKLIARGEA